jgi:uncharacterized CHY-type Zn-finger protein
MKFKDAAHLFRLAGVFVLGLLGFLAMRGSLVPKSFGQYGHYRGDALKEIKAQPISYAGHETCEACHVDVLEVKSKGKHAAVNCESCHGPLAKHALNPIDVKPELPDTAKLCARCHEANTAKPKHFPQVTSAEHSAGLACKQCHTPHSPVIAEGGKK